MSEWIGDRAVEAVQALAGEKNQMQGQLQAAHTMLDQLKIPNTMDGPGGTGRPLTLPDRIQLLWNAKVSAGNPADPSVPVDQKKPAAKA